MSTPLTKEHLDQQFGRIDERFDGIDQQFLKVDQKVDGMETRLSESIRGLNTNFNKSQAGQNERLGTMDEKLDSIGEDVTKIKHAVVDMMGTDRHMHNLVRELKIKGIPLEESRIFTGTTAP